MVSQSSLVILLDFSFGEVQSSEPFLMQFDSSERGVDGREAIKRHVEVQLSSKVVVLHFKNVSLSRHPEVEHQEHDWHADRTIRVYPTAERSIIILIRSFDNPPMNMTLVK